METNSSEAISPNSESTSRLAEMLSTASLSLSEDGIRITRQEGSSARKVMVGLAAWPAAPLGPGCAIRSRVLEQACRNSCSRKATASRGGSSPASGGETSQLLGNSYCKPRSGLRYTAPLIPPSGMLSSAGLALTAAVASDVGTVGRSEERRVGEDGMFWWS